MFWIKFIVHRFIRILPPYLALILLIDPLRYFACQGPLCPPKNNSNCYNNYWTNLLNINNFWDEDKMCAAWTWYLANDFQFFCLSPIFLMLLVTIQPLAWVRKYHYFHSPSQAKSQPSKIKLRLELSNASPPHQPHPPELYVV